MTHDPVQLATKIARFIVEARETHIDVIRARAAAHAIPEGILDNALVILHRNKMIVRTNGVYKVAPPPKPKEPLSHLSWVRNNYPIMNETNDANHPAFNDIDFSWMFLPPAEIEALKQARAFKI